ncbi:MAG: efflux RND transporter periplasmic adaptor subunit [Rhodoplanes sp.]|uniref:HlyD family secretion protein n=1 Tax=Rhodoplanes sp. TaxID=1968906 RepID=UPI00185C3869|nr:efflux RND transporter periplasmic adaptor subunit [Rhodoplanes sp.]NVO13649.1 efflux RND transporter periplasmic adaptor subunit [Rhodoplanes sp.]
MTLRPGFGAVARLALFALFAATLAACNDSPVTYQGWVEANLIFVGPDEAGRVENLSVREGDRVEAKAPLFTIDDALQRADVNMFEAQLENAQQAFDRAKTLLKTQTGTQKTYDDAEAALRTAKARLATAKTHLDRRVLASPVTGTVQQIYFRSGEMVSAGKPVLAILPPGNLKVRFFVPQETLPRIAYGDTVRVRCDGCAADITAKVSFMARSAEFTPPVIYSLQERDKLVFLIEALPDKPEALRVGQPVDIGLGAPSSAPATAAAR